MKKRVLPPTSQRVFLRTDPLVNAEIKNQTIRNLSVYKNCNETDLTERIRSLNMEWDTERIMELNAACIARLVSPTSSHSQMGSQNIGRDPK